MGVANAKAISPNKKLDLTGTWMTKHDNITFSNKGCISLTTDQNNVQFLIKQNGNQFVISSSLYATTYYSRYPDSYQITISGNKIKLLNWTNIPEGRITLESIGTVSNDGNTIQFQGICKFSRGRGTTSYSNTWVRYSPTPYTEPLGNTNYYQFRNNDFARRNPGVAPPDYYLNYGYKYLNRFQTEVKPKLTEQGKEFIRKVAIALQTKMESKLKSDPSGFAELERDSDKFRDFAYKTHIDAYCDSGWGELPLQDNQEIIKSIDTADLINGTSTATEISKKCGSLNLILEK